ncbi:MAG: hypothetical protein COY40_01545 [Alphaproteobacteria bacterium CG_4_10_14_0_8_um_filter_53_9]|nr:MAG: hypothetical protein COY40_01545 [Alphaproteobacteria bacterium CG_4_10_14_0_8_um_filter_53_9]
MVSRISTYFQNQNSLRSLQQANQDVALSTYQITSGNKTNRLGDMSKDVSQVMDLRDITRQTEIYQSNITGATNFLKASEAALQGMSDLLSDAAATAALGRNENSASTRASLAPKAEGLAETFYNLFKTEYNGRYVFSGQNATNAPVSGNASSTAFPGAPVPTTYYQGDSSELVVITGPNTTLNYGVLGDSEGFAKIKAGLESLWYGLENNSLSDIDSAVSILKDAAANVSTMLGQVGGDMNTLEQLNARHESNKDFLSQQLDELEKVDISEALTKLTQQQATLESSLLVITQINRLSLLDYL